MNSNFDLIIFDWDGTLSDSTNLITDLILEIFKEKGVEPPVRDEISAIIGLDLHHAFVRLSPSSSSADINKLKECYINKFRNKSNKVNLFEGVEFGIKELYRQGYQLAVATGGSRRGLEEDLSGSSIKPFFKTTKTVDECFSKPNPQMILEITNELMIDPKKTLMVGDSVFDLQMAINAKVSSLAVTYGSQTKKKLEGLGSLGYVNNSYGMFDWIRRYG